MKEVKLSLFIDVMIPYIQNISPTYFTPKLQGMINKFSKIAGYKRNIKKSVPFLCINNELPEKVTKKTIPFKLHQKIPRNKFNQGGEKPVLQKL